MASTAAGSASDALTPDGVPWRLGEPEVILPIAVQPGQRTSLRLLLRDENGRTRWSTDLGSLEAPPGGSPQEALLKVGTFLKPDDSQGAIQALAAVRTGPDGRVIRSAEDLRGWTFESELPEGLRLETAGLRETEIATSNPGRPDGTKGILSLEVLVSALEDQPAASSSPR